MEFGKCSHLLAALGLLCVSATVASEPCGSGWSEREGFCYRVYPVEATQWGAEDICVAKYGHLVSLHSADEEEFVKGLQVSQNSGQTVWIGLQLDSSNLVWTDGTEVTYTNVVSNREDYQGDCFAKFPSWQAYKWTPSNCPSPFGFVCKKHGDYGEWTQWEEWSDCDCDQGVQFRTRTCADKFRNTPSESCPGEGTEKRECQCHKDKRWAFVRMTEAGKYYRASFNWSEHGREVLECGRYCLRQKGCLVFQYRRGDGECLMFDHTLSEETSSVSAADSSLWQFYSQ